MKSSLAKAALLVTLVTLASRIVGFGRWLAQGQWVGNGDFTNAFNAANLLPNVLFEVAAGGALAGAVVPLIAGPLGRGEHDHASRSASALLGWTLTVLVPLGAVMVLVAYPLAAWLMRNDPGMTDVVAAFLRIFAVQVPMYGIAVVLGGILQAHKRFFWPALSPLISSLVVIGVYWGYAARLPQPGEQNLAHIPVEALNWLAWGITAGVAGLVLPLLLPMMRTQIRLRPTLRFPNGQARRAAHLAFAGVGALIAQQLALVVVMVVGLSINVYTTWLYAYNVYLLPYAVLAFPIATSAFPHFTEHAAASRQHDLAVLVARTTRTLLIVTAVGVAALIAAAGSVQSIFDLVVVGDAPGMAAALTWMAPGLFGYALILHLSRALYAVDHGQAAVMATVAGWGVMVLGVWGVGWWANARFQSVTVPAHDALSALGAAGTVGMTVAGVGLVVATVRHLGSAALEGIARTGTVLLFATTAGAFAGRAVEHLLAAGAAATPMNPGRMSTERSFVMTEFLATLGIGLLAALAAAIVVGLITFAADPAARRRRVLSHD